MARYFADHYDADRLYYVFDSEKGGSEAAGPFLTSAIAQEKADKLNAGTDFNLYDEKNKPLHERTSVVVHVKIPNLPREPRQPTTVRVEIGQMGMIENISGLWLGKRFGDAPATDREAYRADHEIKMEVYSYLCEWELATWLPIGPEDSEIFATRKLDAEWGYGA